MLSPFFLLSQVSHSLCPLPFSPSLLFPYTPCNKDVQVCKAFYLCTACTHARSRARTCGSEELADSYTVCQRGIARDARPREAHSAGQPARSLSITGRSGENAELILLAFARYHLPPSDRCTPVHQFKFHGNSLIFQARRIAENRFPSKRIVVAVPCLLDCSSILRPAQASVPISL